MTYWAPTSVKRMEAYSGTTDGSGRWTITYTPAFLVPPNVQPVIYPSGDSTTRVRIISADANGCVLQTEKNSGAQVLGIDLLGLSTAVVTGVPCRCLVVES